MFNLTKMEEDKEIEFRNIDDKGLKAIISNNERIGVVVDPKKMAILDPSKLIYEDYLKRKNELINKGYDVIN